MKAILMNSENSKTNEPHKFVLNLSQRLDLKSSNKHIALQNWSIYYTWKSTRQQYKNNKLKTITPTWNDEFELPDGSNSVSDIQDYIECIIKNHKNMVLWPSGLGNDFVCKRFAVQTPLWSLEFVIQINVEHDTIAQS